MMPRGFDRLAAILGIIVFMGVIVIILGQRESRTLLIKHGWDIPSISYVVGNAYHMDSSPFDGVVVKMDDGLSARVQSQEFIPHSQFEQNISPMKDADFTTLKHNFLMVYSTPAGDLFDDWSVPLGNFSTMAHAAKDAGLEGIFFDNEEYFGDSVSFPENCGAGATVSQCRDQALLRGRQVMEALISAWPDVNVIVAQGPYVSAPSTAGYFESHGIAWNDVAWANQLRGSFTVGMAMATLGTEAQFVDGGEVYTAETREQFDAVKYWQKYGVANDRQLIPADSASIWPSLVSSSFGVYDREPLDDWATKEPEIWKTTLANALDSSDRYVWAYTESYDWWGVGNPEISVPEAWLVATREARSPGPDPPSGGHAETSITLGK